jgi:hypothetical protein
VEGLRYRRGDDGPQAVAAHAARWGAHSTAHRSLAQPTGGPGKVTGRGCSWTRTHVCSLVLGVLDCILDLLALVAMSLLLSFHRGQRRCGRCGRTLARLWRPRQEGTVGKLCHPGCERRLHDSGVGIPECILGAKRTLRPTSGFVFGSKATEFGQEPVAQCG